MPDARSSAREAAARAALAEFTAAGDVGALLEEETTELRAALSARNELTSVKDQHAVAQKRHDASVASLKADIARHASDLDALTSDRDRLTDQLSQRDAKIASLRSARAREVEATKGEAAAERATRVQDSFSNAAKFSPEWPVCAPDCQLNNRQLVCGWAELYATELFTQPAYEEFVRSIAALQYVAPPEEIIQLFEELAGPDFRSPRHRSRRKRGLDDLSRRAARARRVQLTGGGLRALTLQGVEDLLDRVGHASTGARLSAASR